MARVFVDTSVIGESWFSEISSELLKSEHVRFAYTDHPKFEREQEKARKLKTFYKLAGQLGRRDDVPIEDCQRHTERLESLDVWASESACDDPHIFAMNYIRPIDYIFTHDKRIAKCRDCINPTVDNRYCGFRLVASKQNYEVNRQNICS